MSEEKQRVIPDYAGMSAPLLLGTLGDDAAKWAEAFQQIVVRRGVKIDEGLMIGWFANAIEHSSDVRHRRSQPATKPVIETPLV